MKLNDKLINLNKRPLVKFCGMRRPEDVVAANELGPNLVGFVFAKGSKRLVDAKTAKELGDKLSKDIIKVGVFVNEQPQVIAKLVEDGIIDVAQLHGDEGEDYIIDIKNRFNITIIKAFGISGDKDIEAANASPAHLVLLDNPRGGSGQTFDHSLLAAMDRPYFLAGGLNIDNVTEIVSKYNPYGVDVSSGIETHGFKDLAKMKLFKDRCKIRG